MESFPKIVERGIRFRRWRIHRRREAGRTEGYWCGISDCRASRQSPDFDKNPHKNKTAINIESLNASIRARVDESFLIIKCWFAIIKVSYKGLLKNHSQLAMLFTLTNLVRANQILRWQPEFTCNPGMPQNSFKRRPTRHYIDLNRQYSEKNWDWWNKVSIQDQISVLNRTSFRNSSSTNLCEFCWPCHLSLVSWYI